MTLKRMITIGACSYATLMTPFLADAAGEWPRFRGPTGQGLATTEPQLPVTFDQKNIKWKTPIHGRSWSSPVVWGNQVWLTTATEDGADLFAVCVDRETGKVLHDVKLFTNPSPNPVFKRYNTYASPTPAVEDGRVYITFGSPGTACIDPKTAKIIWERRDIQINHYRGAGSSPTIWNNLLIMNFDGVDQQFVIALNKENGETVWQTKRSTDYGDLDSKGQPQAEGDFRKAFSTPVVTDINGKPTLLSLGSKAFYAYDPASGKELWRVEWKGQHSGSSTPVAGKDLVYTCTGLSKGELWAIKPGGSGVVTDTHVAWKVKRYVPSKPSVLLVDDLIYMVDDTGIASCIDAKTGAEVWRERIKGNFSGSPIHAAGKLYFFAEDGSATVLATGRTFKLLGESKLPEPGVMASPAIAGDSLLVRGKENLYCITR